MASCFFRFQITPDPCPSSITASLNPPPCFPPPSVVPNNDVQGTTRTVRQFHYLEWPDHGVPKTAESFRQFMDAVTATDADLTGPMVVHCSAGIGRTGVFCTVDPVRCVVARCEPVAGRMASPSTDPSSHTHTCPFWA